MGLKIVRRSKTLGNGTPAKAWFFRVSVMLPRKPKRQSHQEITLTLGHDAESLLYGTLEGKEDVFEFTGASVREIIVNGDKADRKRQSELSMTRAFVSKRGWKRWSRKRTNVAENRQRQIAHQVKLAAASLVRWCRSRGVTSVDYETADRGFVPHFPWRALRDRIACALENESIDLHVLGAEPAENEANLNGSVALAGPTGETGE